MFVWRAQTLLDCLRQFEPASAAALTRVAEAWGTAEQPAVLNEVYPTLRKVSVDFAVMEPASRDAHFRVAAVPMPLEWLDIGSWPMFAETCPRDENENALAAQRHVLLDSRRHARGFLRPTARNRHDRLRGHARHSHARRHTRLPGRPGRGDQEGLRAGGRALRE